MSMIWLIPIVLVVFIVYAMLIVPRTGPLTIDTIFSSSQTVMVIGTLILIDGSSPVEVRYGWIMSGATVLYLLTSCLYSFAFESSPARPVRFSTVEVENNLTLRITFGASILVVIAYFYALGYSAFFAGVQGIFSGVEEDVTTLRLKSYSGTQYLYPGYVNQFKNILIPALTTVLISSALAARGRNARMYSGSLAIAATVGLLSTGQRSPFLLFVVVLLCYTYLGARGNTERRYFKRTLYILLGALPFIMLATLVLGRRASSTATGTLARGGGLLNEIGDRILFGNQLSGIAGYRYTETLPTSYGSEWAQGLIGVLPGARGSTLSNKIFQTLYGGTRGTSPPSLWGSIDYNFGFIGLVMAPIILAIALQMISSAALHRQSYNSLELIGMAGMFATVGTWTNGGPAYLLNTGLVTYFLLWAWGRRRSASNSDCRMPDLSKNRGNWSSGRRGLIIDRRASRVGPRRA